MQSGLYRVTYTGKESTGDVAEQNAMPATSFARLRHKLEAFHGKQDPAAVDAAWPHLDHADRFIRSAARVALEHQDPKDWADRALGEKQPGKALAALLALVRVSSSDPLHAGENWTGG